MINKLVEKIKKTKAPIVVGLDPMLSYIPQHVQEKAFAEYGETLDISSDLELEYGTIVSPTVIPFAEYEKYKNDLPYYRNIESEGVEIVA